MCCLSHDGPTPERGRNSAILAEAAREPQVATRALTTCCAASALASPAVVMLPVTTRPLGAAGTQRVERLGDAREHGRGRRPGHLGDELARAPSAGMRARRVRTA